MVDDEKRHDDDSGEITRRDETPETSINAVPEKTVATIATIAAKASHQYQYSGPLPPPEVLRQFDEIVPNGAERIFNVFEQQTEHRIKLERHVANSELRRSWWGLIFGFVIAMTTITGGCLVAAYVSPAAGGTIATASVAALVAAFIYGTNVRSHERKARLNQLTGPVPTPKPSNPDSE